MSYFFPIVIHLAFSQVILVCCNIKAQKQNNSEFTMKSFTGCKVLNYTCDQLRKRSV